jgi:hypothetical protein
MSPGTQRLLAEGAWFAIWAMIIGVMAWLIGQPSARVPFEAILGGLGALSAFRLLT